MLKLLKFTIIGLMALIITACASTPAGNPFNQPMSWPARAKMQHSVTHWRTKGSMGISVNGKSGIAYVDWYLKNKNTYAIDLSGPLGIGDTLLESTPQNVQLLKQGNLIAQSSNADQLLEQELGWSLPVENLYYWIRGIPAPNLRAKMTWDQYNHLQTLKQQGWSVEYLQYTRIPNSLPGLDLPTEIVLTYPTPDPTLKFKINIASWQVFGT